MVTITDLIGILSFIVWGMPDDPVTQLDRIPDGQKERVIDAYFTWLNATLEFRSELIRVQNADSEGDIGKQSTRGG